MEMFTCQNCGYITDVVADAKFCQQCGTKIVEEDAHPAPQLPEPVPHVNSPGRPRTVLGRLVKQHLLAKLLEGGVKKSGRFEVRTDGVIYITSARWGYHVIQVPVEDIASVGIGGKKNVLAIHRKNGGTVLVKMGGAHRWVKLIQINVH